MNNLIQRLKIKSEESRISIKIFLDLCRIYYADNSIIDDFVFFLDIVVHHWDKSTSNEFTKKQMNALKVTKNYFSYYNQLLKHFTESEKQRIIDDQKYIIGLIENSISAPESIQEAKKLANKILDSFIYKLDIFKNDYTEYVIVPDTNSLIISPDPITYCKIFDQDRFEFLITSTVTKELDKLKIIRRDSEFRDKVRNIINRIKGFRNQGSLIQGVKYHQTITVRAIAMEPKFENLLEWLEKENDDDRLIATVLNESINSPSKIVVLVTSDLNLQNKAELAMINYCETPKI